MSMHPADCSENGNGTGNPFPWPNTPPRPLSAPRPSRIDETPVSPDHRDNSSPLDDDLDLDQDDLVDLQLPALPSELESRCRNGNGSGRGQKLPSPKHLAGEAMVSESNSEDESTSTSSSMQL